jgi:hypothetical protein
MRCVIEHPWLRFGKALFFDSEPACLVYAIGRFLASPSERMYWTGKRYVVVSSVTHGETARVLSYYQARAWLRRTDAPAKVHEVFFPRSLQDA